MDAPSAREVTPRRASAVVLAHAAGTAATRLGAPDAVGTACARAAKRRAICVNVSVNSKCKLLIGG